MNRRAFLTASTTTALIASTAPFTAFAAPFYDDGSGFGASGYDPVAYFTEGKPVEGDSAHTSEFDGVTYRFASADSKAQFDGEPAKYAPQYGGYCAFAVSKGSIAPTDPGAWTVYNDRLYLNYSKSVRTLWSTRKKRNVELADANWPDVAL